MECDAEIDAVGLMCPLPVLRLRKRFRSMHAGAVLRISTDDPVAVVDIPHVCAEDGHRIEDRREDGTVTVWTIRKGAVPADAN